MLEKYRMSTPVRLIALGLMAFVVGVFLYVVVSG